MTPIVLTLLAASLTPSQVYKYSDSEGSFTVTIIDETTCEINYGEEIKTVNYTYDGKVLVLAGELSFIINEDNTLSQYVEEEKKTYTYEEVKEIVTDKLNEFKKWTEETRIFGYSLAGIMAMIPSLVLTFYSMYQRKKERTEINDTIGGVQAKSDEVIANAEKTMKEFEKDIASYKASTFEALDNFKAETLQRVQAYTQEQEQTIKELKENVKVLENAVWQLKNYEQFEKTLNTTALMIKELANTPEFVKYGVTEKINDLFKEVK